MKRTITGLTEDDFLFWVVSPADSLQHGKLDQLFKILGKLGFHRGAIGTDPVEMGEGRKDFFPYSLYPLVGEHLAADVGDATVDLWVGTESATERALSDDPRRSGSSHFDLTGIVMSTPALRAGTKPLGDLWSSFPEIVKTLGGVYACGLTQEFSNITMNVSHHFEKLACGEMPSLAGLVVVAPESSQAMFAQLERAAAGTDSSFELADGFGTLWCSGFPLDVDETQWGKILYWITDNQIRVKAGEDGRWPTWLGRTNVDPASFGITSELVDAFNSWSELASAITEEKLQLESCGFASEEDLEEFVADGLAATKELAKSLGKQIWYSPIVARHQTVYPPAAQREF